MFHLLLNLFMKNMQIFPSILSFLLVMLVKQHPCGPLKHQYIHAELKMLSLNTKYVWVHPLQNTFIIQGSIAENNLEAELSYNLSWAHKTE